MVDNQEYTTKELIDQILDEGVTNFPVATALDISERVNQSRRLTRDALEQIREGLKHKNSDVTLNALMLLETLVKNSNESFHYEVGAKKFQETFLKLLRYKRKKANIMEKMVAKEKNWRKIEEKVLYLFQLWADTFMMVEDQYPHIMNNYKLLRKEGIQFPARDPSEKIMINFQGAKSPIFEVLDDVSKREQEDQEKREITKANFERKKKGQPPVFSSSKREDVGPNIIITTQDLEELRNQVSLLVALMESATTCDELNSELANETYDSINKSKEKISKALRFKCFKDVEHQNICADVYQQAQSLLKSFSEKGQEMDELSQAIKVSEKEHIDHQNKEITKQKLQSFKIQGPGIKPPSHSIVEESKVQEVPEQNNAADANLLDMDDEPQQKPQQQVIQPPAPVPQPVQQVPQQVPQIQPPPQQQPVQTQKSAGDDLLDMFADNGTKQPQQQQVQTQQQPQQNINLGNIINQQYQQQTMQQQMYMNQQQGFNPQQQQFMPQQQVNQMQQNFQNMNMGQNQNQMNQNIQQQNYGVNQQQNRQPQQQNNVDDLFGTAPAQKSNQPQPAQSNQYDDLFS